MMKTSVAALAVAGLCFGQGRVGPVGQGFGSVVFPGTGIPRLPSAGPGHASNLGAAVRGVYPAQPGLQRYRSSPAIAVPVPVFVGGYGYGYGGGYGPQEPQPAPNITVVNTPQQSPSVIINQNYTPDRVQPVMHDYPANNSELGAYQAPVPSHPEPPRPAPAPSAGSHEDDDSPTIYLIALKDGTVYPAYAYWLEADTLHYITTKHSHNKASLALVDEPLSLQLNRERRVAFKLKGK